jgi:hypothetical protein
MDKRRYRDSALGAFVGFVGIVVICIILVINNYFNPSNIEPHYKKLPTTEDSSGAPSEIDTLNKNIDTIEGCTHSIYEDEYVMWITANGDTIWE